MTDGVAMLFAKGMQRTSDALSFRLEGTGKTRCFVSGLVSGEWRVSTESGVKTVSVPEDSGLLVLEAEAGGVSLEKR
jgi:hypothetical protein